MVTGRVVGQVVQPVVVSSRQMLHTLNIVRFASSSLSLFPYCVSYTAREMVRVRCREVPRA
jgi:hypothetical protein